MVVAQLRERHHCGPADVAHGGQVKRDVKALSLGRRLERLEAVAGRLARRNRVRARFDLVAILENL